MCWVMTGLKKVVPVVGLFVYLSQHNPQHNTMSEYDKKDLTRLLSPDNETSLEELKFFATSINNKIELIIKSKGTPGAELSRDRLQTRIMFPTYIRGSDLGNYRPSLIEMIKLLHAELTALDVHIVDDESTQPCRQAVARPLPPFLPRTIQHCRKRPPFLPRTIRHCRKRRELKRRRKGTQGHTRKDEQLNG